MNDGPNERAVVGSQELAPERGSVPYLMADRYEMEERPSNEELYRAWDRVTESEVWLRSLQIGNAELRSRLHREGRAFARIDHPSLMEIHDVVVEPDSPWLTFRLIPETADTLESALGEERKLSPTRAVRIAADLAWALSLLHRERIAYGDLDPGRVHLVHVGFDRETARIGALDRVRCASGKQFWEGRQLDGDPRYLAPEQIEGGTATPASDRFALGCLLYEMLSGTPVVQGRNLDQTVNRMLHLDGPALPFRVWGVPGRVRALLKDLLRHDPRRRPEDTSVLAGRLESAWEWCRRAPWVR